MRRLCIPALVAFSLAIAAGPVSADQVYHTERLTLDPVGRAAGSGMVVNIHPNGPQRYAIEQYQLRHGEPRSSYQVYLHLYLDDGATCQDPGTPASLPTAVIKTNGAGNGTAQLVLTPENIAEAGLLAGMSFPIDWTLSQITTPNEADWPTTHKTDCTIVTLD